MEKKKEILFRVYIVLLFFLILSMVLFYKAVKINTIEGDYWRGQGDSLYISYRPIQADRGNITADDGSLLATSLPFFDIFFDPNSDPLTDEVFAAGIDSLSICLAKYVETDKTAKQIKNHLVRKRKAGARYVKIKGKADYIEVERIKKFPIFRRGQFKGGLIITREYRRQKPFKMLANRTLGYVRDGVQPVGLEGVFDDILSGEEGKRLMQRISQGVWIPLSGIAEFEPKPGADILTTLNVNIQDVSEQALINGLERHEADYGTAIVMETKTGAIKAIANVKRSKEGYSEAFNYAIGSALEPGSTFKLATVMALLEDGHITVDDKVRLSSGVGRFCGFTLKDSKKHNLEESTVTTAFEISSNVGMARLVEKFYKETHNAQQFTNRLKSFHLDKKTGIGLKGEGVPFVKDAYDNDHAWSCTSLPWMSIGYELTITPLQLLNFYNAVANDGVMMKPYLVSGIEEEGKLIERFEPEVINDEIASQNTILEVQELLKGVIFNGTGQKLRTNTYDFAGKTGTCQVDYGKSGSGKKKYRASFAGYFPADNPKYTCFVMIHNPTKNGYYGGTVAGPIFREIGDKIFALDEELRPTKEVKPQVVLAKEELPLYDVVDQNDAQTLFSFMELPYVDNPMANWVVTMPKNDTVELKQRKLDEKLIPNVKGMSLKDALFVLENKGLSVSVKGEGTVKRQSLEPGVALKGQQINLTLE